MAVGYRAVNGGGGGGGGGGSLVPDPVMLDKESKSFVNLREWGRGDGGDKLR